MVDLDCVLIDNHLSGAAPRSIASCSIMPMLLPKKVDLTAAVKQCTLELLNVLLNDYGLNDKQFTAD